MLVAGDADVMLLSQLLPSSTHEIVSPAVHSPAKRDTTRTTEWIYRHLDKITGLFFSMVNPSHS